MLLFEHKQRYHYKLQCSKFKAKEDICF